MSSGGGGECRVAPSFCSIGSVSQNRSRPASKPKLELCQDSKIETVDNLNGLEQTQRIFYQEANEVPGGQKMENGCSLLSDAQG